MKIRLGKTSITVINRDCDGCTRALAEIQGGVSRGKVILLDPDINAHGARMGFHIHILTADELRAHMIARADLWSKEEVP